MLGGGRYDVSAPPPVEEWRLYLLVKITGWTVEQIDSTSSDVLDWLLACHGMEVEIENERRAEERKQVAR